MKNFLIGSLFFILGCSHTTLKTGSLPVSFEEEHQRLLLLGKWKGKASIEDGKSYEWLMERRKDGTYTLWSRLDKGPLYIEEGIWGVSSYIYFRSAKFLVENNKKTAYEPSAVGDAAARIVLLNSVKFTFVFLESNEELTVYKVKDSETL